MVREVARRFRDQYGVTSRSQLRAIGVTRHQVRLRVACGEWEEVGSTVVRLGGSALTPEQALMVLCLGAGPEALASHLSAAWLWRLAEPPERHAVIVARGRSARTNRGDVHRPRDYPAPVAIRSRIPCTNPLRTILDVAGVVTPEELDQVLDRALASKLVTVAGLSAELERLARQGRPGCGPLRRALGWRGHCTKGDLSVLERMALQLLDRGGIKPLAIEQETGGELNYRLDIVLAPGLAMEVDGYAYHQGAEQMVEDSRRRNRVALAGTKVLVYTWRDIAHDGRRVLSELRAALSQLAR